MDLCAGFGCPCACISLVLFIFLTDGGVGSLGPGVVLRLPFGVTATLFPAAAPSGIPTTGVQGSRFSTSSPALVIFHSALFKLDLVTPVVKNLPAMWATRSIPGSGRSPGEGNGYPLQYSCLENPTDRGAWRATVHGVSKSRTHLSNPHVHFHRWA